MRRVNSPAWGSLIWRSVSKVDQPDSLRHCAVRILLCPESTLDILIVVLRSPSDLSEAVRVELGGVLPLPDSKPKLSEPGARAL